MNEIHELGLMYLNYEILNSGYKTIYLGESVPLESLKDLNKYFDNITYICYMTVEPQKADVNNYVKDIKEQILNETSELWLMGRMTEYVEPKYFNNRTRMFKSINELVENI